jgi:hypothetical protein
MVATKKLLDWIDGDGGNNEERHKWWAEGFDKLGETHVANRPLYSQIACCERGQESSVFARRGCGTSILWLMLS